MDYQEYRQSLNQKLAEKVQRELADFREDILSISSQEICNVAYQIGLKSDIAGCFSEADYSTQVAKDLMKSMNFPQVIYEEWLERARRIDLFSYLKPMSRVILPKSEEQRMCMGKP